jgi:DNA-binding NtrC family response regulator
MNANGHVHILIVDDEQDVRDVLKATFQRLRPDYRISLASDGFTALGKMFQETFDLIITDYKMPEMNGLELTEMAHSIAPTTKILLMSGVNPFKDEENFASWGLVGYLRKPFSITRLLDIIEQITERNYDEILSR